MSNRWIRFLLAVLALAAAAAAAYRVVQHEQQLAQEIITARDANLSADSAIAALEELKSTLHAYVAPGQGIDYWAARAQLLLNRTRGALLALDTPATASGAVLAEALDACDRLAAAEDRAARYARNSQPLLAGEVIFTEARDLFDGMRLEVARVRDQINSVAGQRQLELRRQQIYLVAGGAGVLALVMLLLVPTPRSRQIAMAESVSEDRPVPQVEANAEAPRIGTQLDAAALASICHDLARISDGRQLQALLERTRTLLGARGVIVWIANKDLLQPAASSGYADRVVARIGPIRRADDNLTADAFRANSVRSSSASSSTPAALAAPMPAPGGPTGVFSVELTPGAAVDEATSAAAQVIAAQLAGVLGSASPRAPVDVADAPSTAAARSSP